MIPKTVHYIWLGKKAKPKNFKAVLESWQKYASGFEIKEWNESSSQEFNLPKYFHTSLLKRNNAFASDVLRFHILSKYGGIYLDVDEMLLKYIGTEELLKNTVFLGLYHEVDDYFGFGFIGSVPGSLFSERMISFYNDYSGEKDSIVNTIGSQIVAELNKENSSIVKLFPQEFFYPLTKKDETKNTYARHLSNTSWVPTWKKVLQKMPYYLVIKKIIFSFLPKSFSKKLSRIVY